MEHVLHCHKCMEFQSSNHTKSGKSVGVNVGYGEEGSQVVQSGEGKEKGISNELEGWILIAKRYSRSFFPA